MRQKIDLSLLWKAFKKYSFFTGISHRSFTDTPFFIPFVVRLHTEDMRHSVTVHCPVLLRQVPAHTDRWLGRSRVHQTPGGSHFGNEHAQGTQVARCRKTRFNSAMLTLCCISGCLSLSGGKPETEFYIRLFFRRIFLDQCGVSIDKAFWLRHILKPFPMVHQARLLFLFYGPVIQGKQCVLLHLCVQTLVCERLCDCADEVQWFEMCESAPFSREQVISCFNELSNAFKILHNHKYWSEDDIISVIEEITSETWVSHSFPLQCVTASSY